MSRRPKPQAVPAAARLRCALYTRKSSEEGLEQAFNSLHAQREACEAYVLSQAGEGWSALPQLYDDGGFSGGSMERPALQQLLADVRARRVDVVVVYKVDRLTRALADFAKIVEVFDSHGVSFVSVTQAFNTTTSMGRLTLNVLLSFAQFEREVTGERIRDKIAASKAKGMWMGGTPPLGYRVQARALHVVESEAEQVRAIFRRYLALGSVHELKRALEAEGVRSRKGAVLARGALFLLLKNRIYRGEIVHRDKVHPGLHAPIVDAELFEAVQARLAVQAPRRRSAPALAAGEALLKGRVFDEAGRPMSPVFTHRHDRVYRYYVSSPLQLGARPDRDDFLRRVPAPPLEQLVRDRMTTLTREADDPLAQLRRVEVRSSTLHLVIAADAHRDLTLDQLARRLVPGERAMEDGEAIRIVLPVRFAPRGGRTQMLSPAGAPAAPPRLDPRLVQGLRDAHALRRRLERGEVLASTHARRLVEIAYLAPDLQRAILDGRQPVGLTIKDLFKMSTPLLWSAQSAALTRV